MLVLIYSFFLAMVIVYFNIRYVNANSLKKIYSSLSIIIFTFFINLILINQIAQIKNILPILIICSIAIITGSIIIAYKHTLKFAYLPIIIGAYLLLTTLISSL